jgi:hypothetical protein
VATSLAETSRFQAVSFLGQLLRARPGGMRRMRRIQTQKPRQQKLCVYDPHTKTPGRCAC